MEELLTLCALCFIKEHIVLVRSVPGAGGKEIAVEENYQSVCGHRSKRNDCPQLQNKDGLTQNRLVFEQGEGCFPVAPLITPSERVDHNNP